MMLAPSEVQCNALPLFGRNNAKANTPVRSSDGSRAMRSTRIPVSLLCSTSPCAACRSSSGRFDHFRPFFRDLPLRRGFYNGMPSGMFQLFQAINGMPLPYLSSAIMAAVVSPYFSTPLLRVLAP